MCCIFKPRRLRSVQSVKYLIVKPLEGTGVVISKIFRLFGMEAFCLGMDTAGCYWVLSDVSMVQQLMF